jgi:hypothetical protein
MKPLNEQTIKRLQKLADINEIKINSPGKYTLQDIIRPITGINSEDYMNHPYADVYSTLIMWVESFSGFEEDPTSEYTTEIYLDYLEDIIEDEDAPQEIVDWVEKAKNLIPNQMYIYNINKYMSYKFTTDSNGELHTSIPSGMTEDGILLSKYDDKGNLIPNN